ncbi:YrdB family protein [Deinococcus humi]|uniref:CHASE2 domain-containing sensor protein n=1 Tax=Deinococcus humi TaxID=662880 RepID=A0A7W8NCC5_9DEIO|nr:YrdB family protein [Deinococcus humi]MBB5362024.1 CHASE2 domain-containing sensor protein [Deinococcus humi]GGO22456.1 hypothetical protein GCM10008949_09710 [Deinococcus humi]
MNTNSVRLEITPWDGLAFCLELAAVVAVGVWDQQTAGWPGLIAAPLVLTVFWGAFLSPRASRPVRGLAWQLAKLAVFMLACAALLATAGLLPAAAFLGLALLSVLQGGTR